MSENQTNTMPVPQDIAGLPVAHMAGPSGVEAGDIQIPRFLLMQPTSEMVGEDNAKVGDIIDNLTNEVLGGADKPVEVIPLALYKTLVTEDASAKPPKFLRQERLIPALDLLPWEGFETIDGKPTPVKRSRCLNFFVMPASHVADGLVLPYVVRFKGSSYGAGKQLATMLYIQDLLKQAPYARTVLIGSKKEKKDTNVYSVYTVAKGREATDAELSVSERAFGDVQALMPKVNLLRDEAEAPARAPEVQTGSPTDTARF